MKLKSTLAIASLIVMAASSYAAIPVAPTLLTDTTNGYTGQLYRESNYIFGAGEGTGASATGVTLYHSNTGNRHLIGTYDLNGYTNAVVTNTTGFELAFDGATIQSTSPNNTLTFTKQSGAGETFLLAGGLTIDNAKVITDTNISVGRTTDNNLKLAKITLKNGGIFEYKYTGTQYWDRGFDFNIENGSFHFTNSGRAMARGTITKLSEDASAYGFGIYGSSTLTIGAGIDKKIKLTGALVLNNASTLILNSSSVFSCVLNGVRSEKIFLEVAGAAVTSKVALGANNDFSHIVFRRAAGTTLTFDLNSLNSEEAPTAGISNSMKIDEFDMTNFTALVIEDFEDNKFAVKTVLNGTLSDLLSKITAPDATNTLAFREGADGYNYLYAIPEPAEWAAIFGAIALGLVVYRRRK